MTLANQTPNRQILWGAKTFILSEVCTLQKHCNTPIPMRMFSRRRLDPISRYRHLMDGIDGPFPDQEAIRRSLNTDMRRRVSPLGAREHMDQHAPPLPPFHHRRPRLATGIHPGSVGYGVTAGTGSNSDSDHDNSQFNNDFGSQRRRYLNRIARVARSQVR